ncbi:MAG TPA: 16S rRNA (guanine(966)-N(2))-methyltransferase RsmD [Rhizomicrobium sp.]|jgi:16S rRNA (guanine966-N2)-methyltransferase|nr:16S rRNA (guanine(966)-N(2))-methyltransferase RsmD [Rhizomicrobium sp.]
MRITGGRFGGRMLAGPSDDRVRPTSDKVRQAIFNVLAHNDFGCGFSLEGARVIDLFAGTGAMGLEGLSRGARYCLFVDNSAESRALIRSNVEALALTGATKIWRRDATALGPLSANAGGLFDLALLDPPYRQSLLLPSFRALRDGKWLAPDAVVVAEYSVEETLPEFAGFETRDARSYGDTSIAILRVMTPMR